MTRARLAEIALPDFGPLEPAPEIPGATYAARLERLRSRAEERGFDRLVVYADREHSANLAYLTGFDPRFEEAVLDRRAGWRRRPSWSATSATGMAGAAPLTMRRDRFQDLSLPSQPRDRSKPLAEILAGEGIGRGSRVGVIGWKTYGDPGRSDAPSYLVDEVRALVGDPGLVENATDLLIDAADGLRVINEVEQLAFLEHAACRTSSGVRRVLTGLRPGMTEREAVRAARMGRHAAVLPPHADAPARDASLGLLSPGDRPIERGDPFTVAFGIWGALNCRAGFVVEGADELPDGIGDYVERLVAPVLRGDRRVVRGAARRPGGGVLARRSSTATWATRSSGSSSTRAPDPPRRMGELADLGRARTIELRSGMAFQVDIIPATGHGLLHDEHRGRDRAGRRRRCGRRSPPRYPAAWARIQARRRFMSDALGIDLHPDVLPFSNIPAYLPPFLLRPDVVMTVAR